ncbi:YncE family protein [Nonomuraea sp. NEAU-A123]|uniref:YncE family protein n=1 Tax=Nonomuraea sp. NEAU-A123 TaxID=2839649 RepID=UPI001BE4D38B|nr:YncE family protein [Nonomuraea sp. NEAU-A123]MBT2225214.1 YncE family protein [Nonomuraea sp. NEAU-A123]
MRLPRMTSMLVATAIAVVSCGPPPAPMVATVESAPPLKSPPRRHAQPLTRKTNVYAHDRPGMLSPRVKNLTPRVYVPNSESNTVDVIDPRTFRVVHRYRVGALPQHVVPSWDLKTLWVNENKGNRLTPINPVTGRPGKPVPVDDPYNLYFTPDGSYALVMAERNNRLDFRDPHTMRLIRSLDLPCRGVNHGDFTADGSVFLASCEFSGQLVAIDWRRHRVKKAISVGAGNMPQDVKLSPDGRRFYVADMMAGGVWIIDADTFRRVGFLRTGKGAHGLYVSRNARLLYVSNRGEGTVSVVSFARREVVDRWRIPGGGSPDMGGVSADGKQLWLSGRYHGVVYVFSTETGRLLHKIKVGQGPHGLCFYPQPGRYSLGHTGVFR